MAPHALKKRKLTHQTDENRSVIDSSSEGTSSESGFDDGGPVSKTQRASSQSGSVQKTRPRQIPQTSSEKYGPGIFQMQIEELLSEVRPNYEKYAFELEQALRKIKELIERFPSRKAASIPEAERHLRQQYRIAVPFPTPRPKDDAQYTLGFEKPANITIVGSYARRTTVRADGPMVIDMALTMPSILFQEKDYLNYRYFYKRAYYIACVAAGIQDAQDCNFNLQFAYQNDCQLQPVLLISSSHIATKNPFSLSKAIVRILLAADKETFPADRTFPWKNCLRARNDTGTILGSTQSPLYNATLRAECSTGLYVKLLHGALTQCTAFKDACILGTVWLRQRGFMTGLRGGGFGAFELATSLALLLRGGGSRRQPILSIGYSSYQLFKALLQFLATRDLIRQPKLLFSDSIKACPVGSHDIPLLFDGSGGLNILYKMTPWSYNMLRHEARITVSTLNGSTIERFQPSFITKVNEPALQFDTLIRVVIPGTWQPTSEEVDFDERVLEFCSKFHRVLTTALGDRAILICPWPACSSPWPIVDSDQCTPGKDASTILIGILVDSTQVGRTVDRGPPAEDKEAASAFRRFWGEKAELRRFKDGSILESTIWSENPGEKSILQQIVGYVVGRHFGQGFTEGVDFVGDSFDQILPMYYGQDSSSIAMYQPALSAYEALEKQMRGLKGLPLQIRKISASHADLRYGSNTPFIPNRRSVPNYPMDVIVQFEGSARWPDDLSAIQRTKIAFLLKLGELLEVSVPRLSAQLGLENGSQKLLNNSFLDIVYPDAAATFRLRIHHDRELTLLERQLKDKSGDSRSKEQAASAISGYKRSFIQAPAHTQSLRSLCTRFPLLSPTIRLMKHWCNSHLLSNHIDETLIELLTIRTFVHPHPWQAPGSLRTGFLRTLASIAKWDWRFEPLVVDFNGEMTAEEIGAIAVRFQAWRKIDPAMNRIVMFAASNLDHHGITWTEHGPSKLVATRLTSLAKAACRVVKDQGLDIDVGTLFKHSLTDYDFVLNVNPEFYGGLDGKTVEQSSFKNFQKPVTKDVSLIGYDPVQLFVEELKYLYGNVIVFFYNSSEPSCIAGLWSPSTGQRKWKINLPYSTVPTVDPTVEEDRRVQVTINQTAMLNDIARLGGDMVEGILNQRH